MLLNQVDIGGILLFIPNPAGLVSGGILSIIAFFISLLFSVMVVVWVGLSIYAGIKIIMSQANPEGLQGGMTIIKNIWAGIAMFLIFLVVLSVIGAFTGVGDIYSWSSNLAQCGGADGPFLFQYMATDLDAAQRDDERREYAIGCCDGEWDSLDVTDVGLNEFFRFRDSCESITYKFL